MKGQPMVLWTCDGCSLESRLASAGAPNGWRRIDTPGHALDLCDGCWAAYEDRWLALVWATIPGMQVVIAAPYAWKLK